MIPFLGLALFILASMLSFTAFLPFLNVPHAESEALLKRVSTVQLALMLGSFFTLMYACGSLDFSVLYVVSHTHTALPMPYRLAATWGGHEGSLLLWLLLLSVWTFCFSRTQVLTSLFKRDTLCVLQLIFLFFSLFVLFTSNPFARVLPLSPVEGKDLNPLLQDPGLIFHPPLLYVGYVGAAIPYAFTLAALKNKIWTPATAKALRSWVLIAWSFLTAGITLGSFWAYYELGWGGFWFWDPVENASVMPWFCLTGLLHALIVCEKREMLKRLCMLLSLFAFLFSVLGTFLVRSGVLVSVHAFANDPARGQSILIMLFFFSLLSLVLYLWRVPQLKEQPVNTLLSKEGMLSVGSVIFFTMAMIVVLGTLYPIILEIGFNEKISVGAPYFNALILPIGLVTLVLAALAPTVTWLKFTAPIRRHAISISIALCLTLLGAWYWQQTGFYFFTGIMTAIWLIEITLYRIVERLKIGKAFSKPFFGMILGHVGIAVLALGLSLTTSLSVVRELNMHLGETVQVGNTAFTFESVKTLQGPNYTAQQGQFLVKEENCHTLGPVPKVEILSINKAKMAKKPECTRQYMRIFETFLTQLSGKRALSEQARMYPEKRVFFSGTQAITEMARDAGLHRDILIALGEPIDATHWSVRLQIRPYICLIWLGGILMALGGILSALGKKSKENHPVASSPRGDFLEYKLEKHK